ncbi:uncharacterized protein K02A2.6 [Trichonephila clavipes]|nr:uncharacterized protein K02A2.6 [Trichonephila clavipes]
MALNVRSRSHQELYLGPRKKYSQIDKEALSIVWAVRKFYLYLKGRRFTLITNHKPLIAIFGSKEVYQCWQLPDFLHYALILQSFEFDIIFRKTIENEIDRLEKEGIIEKVDSSEWATPVVPVVKSDGSIRLCVDYSVTLNPNLIVPQHPLPRLDEIFGSLNGENNLQN